MWSLVVHIYVCRELYEMGKRAFVSFVRFYYKHECKLIFQAKGDVLSFEIRTCSNCGYYSSGPASTCSWVCPSSAAKDARTEEIGPFHI